MCYKLNTKLRTKIMGERFFNPPKMLSFQAKGPLLDETLESLNRAPKEQADLF